MYRVGPGREITLTKHMVMFPPLMKTIGDSQDLSFYNPICLPCFIDSMLFFLNQLLQCRILSTHIFSLVISSNQKDDGQLGLNTSSQLEQNHQHQHHSCPPTKHTLGFRSFFNIKRIAMVFGALNSTGLNTLDSQPFSGQTFLCLVKLFNGNQIQSQYISRKLQHVYSLLCFMVIFQSYKWFDGLVIYCNVQWLCSLIFGDLLILSLLLCLLFLFTNHRFVQYVFIQVYY